MSKQFATSFFVVRTPLESADALLMDADKQRALSQLQAFLRKAETREALYFANVAHQLTWSDFPRDLRVQASLFRYATRMSTRPTPFGAFSAYAVGAFSDRTSFERGDFGHLRSFTQLDARALTLVAEQCRKKYPKDKVRYRKNDSLWTYAEKVRFVRRENRAGSPRFVQQEADESEELRQLLQLAESSASFVEIVTLLAGSEARVEKGEAEDFASAAIDAGLLEPLLEVSCVGAPPLIELIGRAREAGFAEERALRSLASKISQLDQLPRGNRQRAAERVATETRKEWEIDESVPLFHMSSFFTDSKLSLSLGFANECLHAVETLARIQPPSQNAFLANLRDAFVAKFEAQEVELCRALDGDFGIDIYEQTRTSVDDTPFGTELVAIQEPAKLRDQRERDFLLESYIAEDVAAGKECLELTESRVRSLAALSDVPPLPSSFAAVVSAVPRTGGRDLHPCINYAVGPSGVRFFGRFCHGDDNLYGLVKDHLQAEQRAVSPARLFEISHFGEGALANVTARPRFLTHGTRFLSGSSQPHEQEIPLNEIVLSVEGAHFILKWKRTGERLLPRSTTVYTSNSGPIIYRFLCALQCQGTAGAVTWQWGSLNRRLFVPRVVFGTSILSLARWRLSDAQRTVLASCPTDRIESVSNSFGIPALFHLVEFEDQALLVNLRNSLSAEMFRERVLANESAWLREIPSSVTTRATRVEQVALHHELVIPYVRHSEHTTGTAAPSPRTVTSAIRGARYLNFTSGWVFAKLYGSEFVLDKLLRDELGDLLEEFHEQNVKFFFVRYADPRPHLRLRIQSHARWSDITARLLERTNGWLVHRLLDDVQFATYQREVERYGGSLGMAAAEELFFSDSIHVLRKLRRMSPPRWTWPLATIEALTVAFELPEHDVQELYSRRCAHFRTQYTVRGTTAKAWSASVRSRASLVDHLVEEGLNSHYATASSEDIKTVVNLSRGNDLSTNLVSFVGDLIHMHCNRIFKTAANQYEFFAYDLMRRRLQARVAIRSDART